ncbi:uncharacterized protein LOC131644825 [Vicia villosa]|uniref:uncharacterized protein LOC131644825 n=1 Tax=Vicia villosa TaxID=3911 RepID=UPI00273B21DF|nr:uncharacterized protein LOC131644825 [Vicia villosa]XP_058771404.1 uncharacterized protein LOC131644825 [Vicia villosa]
MFLKIPFAVLMHFFSSTSSYQAHILQWFLSAAEKLEQAENQLAHSRFRTLVAEDFIKKIPRVRGSWAFANLGNTCFLNSITQCFTHTVPLVEGLLSCNHSTDGHSGYCVICAFRYQMQHSLQSTGTVISPVILVDNLKRILNTIFMDLFFEYPVVGLLPIY